MAGCVFNSCITTLRLIFLLGAFIHSILQQVLSVTNSRRCLHAAPEAEDVNTGTGTEGPPIKRCKKDETDLSFLLVKNKDGQDGLFVDLGKRSHNLFLLFTLHSVTNRNSYH